MSRMPRRCIPLIFFAIFLVSSLYSGSITARADTPLLDSDGDGIPDVYEMYGIQDEHGSVLVDLKAMAPTRFTRPVPPGRRDGGGRSHPQTQSRRPGEAHRGVSGRPRSETLGQPVRAGGERRDVHRHHLERGTEQLFGVSVRTDELRRLTVAERDPGAVRGGGAGAGDERHRFVALLGQDLLPRALIVGTDLELAGSVLGAGGFLPVRPQVAGHVVPRRLVAVQGVAYS